MQIEGIVVRAKRITFISVNGKEKEKNVIYVQDETVKQLLEVTAAVLPAIGERVKLEVKEIQKRISAKGIIHVTFACRLLQDEEVGTVDEMFRCGSMEPLIQQQDVRDVRIFAPSQEEEGSE